MDLSFPGQRTATATLCIPLDSVYMPGPRIGKSEYGFFGCDTWLRIFQNDSQKSHWLHSSIKFANPVTCTKILSTFFQDQTLWSLNWGVPKEKFHCILHVHLGLLILNLGNAWLTRLDCSQSLIFSWDRRGPLVFQMYRGGRAGVWDYSCRGGGEKNRGTVITSLQLVFTERVVPAMQMSDWSLDSRC